MNHPVNTTCSINHLIPSKIQPHTKAPDANVIIHTPTPNQSTIPSVKLYVMAATTAQTIISTIIIHTNNIIFSPQCHYIFVPTVFSFLHFLCLNTRNTQQHSHDPSIQNLPASIYMSTYPPVHPYLN